MKFETTIVVPNRYNSDYECDTALKRLNILYNVVIGQEIKLNCDGERYKTKVIGVSDSVYEDIIYRYVEVVVIDCDI